MSALARGGTVADNVIPKIYQQALERRGLSDQKRIDTLSLDQARQVIRELLAEVDDARAGKHPLGDGADPTKDYRRQSIRDALRYALRLYHAGVLAATINSREDARVGMRLADRFVSQMEIACALDVLAMERPDLHVILELRYQRGWAPKRVAGQLSIGRETVINRENDGLDFLIGIVWR